MGSDRYSRQERLPFVGREGQEKLERARVAVVGLGAVGGSAAELLARGGVGRIVLIDRDLVELHNLQRQSLFAEPDVGAPKAIAGRDRLRDVNPEIEVVARVKDVHAGNVEGLIEAVDLLVDGTDNLETRYLLNEACVQSAIPFLYGAALAAEGMAGVLWPPHSPCFRCLFPASPPPGLLPTCETVGILGPAATLVGATQATLAMRTILTGEISSHLHVVRAWDPAIERVRVARRVGCPTCEARQFAALQAPHRVVTQLCGGDLVSVDPGSPAIDLDALVHRFEAWGPVRKTPHLLKAAVPPYEITVFPDGRALIRGTSNRGVAAAVYDRYLGS